MFDRISSSLLALALAVPFATACTDTTYDELAGDDATELDPGKADLGGTYTYYRVEPDMRRCAAPMCGGAWISLINGHRTRCADGSRADRCYVASVDYDRLKLSDRALDEVRSAGYGGSLLMRAELGTRDWGAPGEWPELQPSEAWVARGPNPADGVFTKVEDTGVRYITFPCESMREAKLNSSRTAILAELDWDVSGADPDAIMAGIDALMTDAVIVAGDRYRVSGPAGHAKGRTVTQFFTRVKDRPGCYVGGCSNEVCSDRPDVMTTCDWHEEYACYQGATCELQPDGACGWTHTEELDACLSGTPRQQ